MDNTIYGLSSRIELRKSGNQIQIVKQRKSRIIMKDAKTILDIAQKIWAIEHNVSISLLISGLICSKSVKFLNEHRINITENEL